MEFTVLILCFVYFEVATSQCYSVPAASYLSYSNSYYPSSPSFTSNNVKNSQRKTLPSPSAKLPKRSIGNTAPAVKSSPQTASAYFLTKPTENIKATVLNNEKLKETKKPVPYSCPLCNNFADVPRNSKISPPPPVSPVLPGIIDTVPTIPIPKNLTLKDPDVIRATKSLFSDMCEKHKVPKKLSFDQELLEGFLTGLGLAS